MHAFKWYGADRSLYLPTGLLDPSDIPDYLSGELAGDYGYDPLGLGKDGNVAKYREAELIHARWAMLGALGAIVPEAIQAYQQVLRYGQDAALRKDVTNRIQACQIQIQALKEAEEMMKEQQKAQPPAEGGGAG